MEYRREESGERVGGSGEGVEKEWRRSERRCSGSCGSNAKPCFHRDMSGTSLGAPAVRLLLLFIGALGSSTLDFIFWIFTCHCVTLLVAIK